GYISVVHVLPKYSGHTKQRQSSISSWKYFF
ncbi:MAG: hypothetical protein ACI86L_001731, partial [Dokdonia sp.]